MADASSSNNAVVNPEDTGSLGNGHSKQLADPELEAAEALGGLRHAVSPPPPGSPLSAVETTLPTVTKTADFISRVSNYPVVNSGIERISRIYEAGKESHAIVKVGLFCVENATLVFRSLTPNSPSAHTMATSSGHKRLNLSVHLSLKNSSRRWDRHFGRLIGLLPILWTVLNNMYPGSSRVPVPDRHRGPMMILW